MDERSHVGANAVRDSYRRNPITPLVGWRDFLVAGRPPAWIGRQRCSRREQLSEAAQLLVVQLGCLVRAWVRFPSSPTKRRPAASPSASAPASAVTVRATLSQARVALAREPTIAQREMSSCCRARMVSCSAMPRTYSSHSSVA